MESREQEIIANQLNNNKTNSINVNKKNNNQMNIYGPEILFEKKSDFFIRKFKREFMYCM